MRSNVGFTLLEMLVAIAILGLLAAVSVPVLMRDRPKEVREKFLAKLNSLTGFAWQNAIKNGKFQKVSFDFKKREVRLFQETGKTDKYGKKLYAPLKRTYIRPYIKIPEQFEIKTFFIEGKEQISAFGPQKSEEVWFLITDGLSQAVVINFFDKLDKVGRSRRPIGLVLNPFSAQFEVYDEFKKP